jgi:hypothetical protein
VAPAALQLGREACCGNEGTGLLAIAASRARLAAVGGLADAHGTTRICYTLALRLECAR